MINWHSVATAPLGLDRDSGPEFLGYGRNGFCICWHAGHDDEDGKPAFFNGDVFVDITHWAPLPNKPNDPYKNDPGALEVRYTERGMDDVAVRDVTMFRMEWMDDNAVWICCYVNQPDRERVVFHLSAGGKISGIFDEDDR